MKCWPELISPKLSKRSSYHTRYRLTQNFLSQSIVYIFFLCVCAHDCRSKYFPYQFFFCYFWDILTIPFFYKSTKYFKFQSSVTDTLFSYVYDWNYLHMIWGRSTFIPFKDIVIFYTYKIEWKLFQTKYHEPRFSHTAFPRCIFKFISNQCNL